MKKKTIKNMKSALMFLLKLNLLAIPLYLIVTLGFTVPQFQHAWAYVLGGSLNLLGYEAVVEGSMIGVKAGDSLMVLELSWDSTGWKSLYALTALVMASGVATLKGKAKFLAFGLPLVALLNLIRIVSTSALSIELGFIYFDFIHGFLWSTVMIGFVVGIWYLLFFRDKIRVNTQ